MTTSLMAGRMFAHAHHGTHIEETSLMYMVARIRRWTRTDLERLPDDGNRYEVVRGELFVTPAPATRHQALVTVLVDRLRSYVNRAGIGQVDQAPSAMVFERSEVQPDIVVRSRALPPPPKWEQMPMPFLVVEILSESTRRRDRTAKRALYHDAGIAEYWLVDPEKRSIHVVRAEDETENADTMLWHPSGATEPLALDIAGVFREALG